MGKRGVDVTIVMDSQPVLGSIKKRMGPEPAWGFLDEVEEMIKANAWGIEVKWVESDGNVAHSATHAEPITGYRINRSWKVAMSEGYDAPEGGNVRRNREGEIVGPKRPREE